jgi:hypothetical protein
MNRDERPHLELRRVTAPVLKAFKQAERAGVALPEELRAARARFETVEQAIAAVVWPPDPKTAAAALAGDLEGAEEIPDDLGERLMRAEADHEAARAQTQVLRKAEWTAGRALARVFAEAAEEIVTDCLRPRLQEVLDEAAALVPVLKGARDPNALVEVNDQAAFKAWSALGLLFERYCGLREVYDAVFNSVLSRELDQTVPNMGGLVRYRNYPDLPAEHGITIVPEQNAAVMAWLVGGGGGGGVVPEPWMPLPDQLGPTVAARRAAVKERIGAGHRKIRAAQHVAGQAERDQRDARAAKRQSPWRGRPAE